MEKEDKINDYSVILDMEDLCRNTVSSEEDEDFEDSSYTKQEVLNFCKKLKDAVSQMDVNNDFEKSIISFGSTLMPEEEDILFYEVAVPFYENWNNMLENSGDLSADFLEMSVEELKSLVAEAKNIVSIFDSYYGYSYFEENENGDL